MSKWVNQFRSKVKKMLPSSRKRALDETYDIKDTLGSGIFSVVKKAVNKKTGEHVAIKIYDKSRLTSYDKDCTTTEVELLKSLKHPNIIIVKDCIDTRSKLYLVEELMTGGDLLETIRKKKSFSEKEACRLFSQILTAIAFLHANGIAHRDIKPDNILLSGDCDEPVVKLADFGFAKKVGSGTLHTPCGSPVYAAPEIAREDSYDKSVDVWSAGVLLYILLCGYPPFYHRDPAKLFEEIKKAVFEFPPEQWNSVSDSAKDLVSSMLRADPTERITAQQALDHPWTVMMTDSTKQEVPPSSTSTSPSSSPSLSHHLPSTASASAADSVLDKKIFKIHVNKALEQGTQFNLCPATSSSIWERRRSKARKSEKFDKFEKSEKSEKSESEKSNKSNSDKSARERRRRTARDNKEATITTSTEEGKKRMTDSKGEGGRESKGEHGRSDSRGEERRSESKGEDRSEDRSEMLSTIEAYSLSRSSSGASGEEEDGFSFLTQSNGM